MDGGRVCRVRPDVAAVGRAFDYLIPTALAAEVSVGSVVRVPLHGRRVRGWVVADDVVPETARARLVALLGVVSAGPPPEMVALADWAARRWAGPVTTFLRAASPANVVATSSPPLPGVAHHPAPVPPGLVPWSDSPVRVVTWPPAADRLDLVRSLCASEGSTLVLVPEPARAGALVRALAADGREVHHHHSGLTDRQRTAVWSAARSGAQVVVGGRAAVWLPVPDLQAVIVLDEPDEAYQEERAPTWHARDVALERARRCGAAVTLVSPVPSVEAVEAAGSAPAAHVAPPAGTLRGGWPVLDVVDLRDEAPGGSVLSHTLGPALQRAVAEGGRALVVVNRRGRARLLACRGCQALARCGTCGAAVGQPADDLVCSRCAASRPPVCTGCGATRFRAVRPGIGALRDDVAALVPRADVAEVDLDTEGLPSASVLVGTEAVLHRVPRGGRTPVRLVAFLAFDEELLAPRYRASEQAAWLLVRAARLLGGRADGGRLVVQTRMPDHPVLDVAAQGDPGPFVAAERAVRRDTGFPPFGAVAEVSGAVPAVAEAVRLLRAAGARVLDGAEARALVRADSAEQLAEQFAAVDLASARAAGRLRVSVDPHRV
ncbi:MAG: hypothetical protein WCI50_02580 [Actinomycetes bacterium]